MKYNLEGYLLSVLALTILLFYCFAVPISALPSSDWDIQIVDTNGARGGNGRICPIVLDSTNKPHISYLAPYTDSKVIYASLTESAWIKQTIAPGNVFSLVMDSKDRPHILYTGLTYASWTGTNWYSQIVDPTVPNGFGSLALDSFGNPHAAYTDGKVVKYAVWTGLNWSISAVDKAEGMPWSLSLALNSNNTPYIMYSYNDDNAIGYFSNSETLKIATLNNSSWTIQTVASNVTMFGNMVLDSQGYPHIIYQIAAADGNSSLVLSRWNGDYWNKQMVVSDTDLVNMGFLELDSHDNPRIVFVSSEYNPEIGDTNTLNYATWTGTIWNIQSVEKGNFTAFGNHAI